MIIPDEGRRELYNRQQVCEVFGLSYIDVIWKERYADNPVSKGAWPYRSVAAQVETNVTTLKKRTK